MNNTKNRIKIWLLPLLLLPILAGCEDRMGLTSPIISTVPSVISTNPTNGSTGIAFNNKITATFSEAMNSSTITTASFTLMQGSSFVSGTVSYTGTTATFAPASNLTANTTYTATITTTAKNISGGALASNYVWVFTTGSVAGVIPPTVISTDPVGVATGVPINQKIAATFSTAMDASTITSSTFTVSQGTTPVPGFVSYSGSIATFAPSSNLAPNTLFTVVISSSVKDLAGTNMALNYSWLFTTGSAAVVTPPTVISTDPVNGATNVSITQKISATFSVTMDAATITTSSFTLMQGTTFVSGTVSYVNKVATYIPSSNLTPNTIYTATITTGAKDLAGNSMASNYVWSFTTSALLSVSLSSNPSAGGTTSGGGLFNPGSTVTVQAIQNAGYTFANWTENGTVVSTNAGYTFVLNGNRTLIANFTTAQAQYTVSLSSSPLTGGTTSGDGTFNSGSSVTVTATQNAGYTFTNWTENGTVVSTNAIYTFILTGNRALVANYAIAQSQFTVSLSSNPSAGGTTSGGGSFNSGSSVTVTATKNAGYTFVNWTENGSPVSTNAVYNFTLTGNRTLVANFAIAQSQFTVSLSSNPSAGGTTSGGGSFNSGSSVTVTATQNAGYTFVNWTENNLPVSTNASYSFTLTGNRTLVANFTVAQSQYTVSLSSNPSAGGTTSGGGSFNSGSSVTVNALANAGYSFTNWTENGSVVSTNASYSFTLTGNRTLVANFASSSPTISLGAAATFGSFGGSAGLTNQGIFTVVNGDLGTTAASTLVTGFHDTGGNIYTETPLNIGTVNGTINCAPPAPGTAAKFTKAQQALDAATTAYNYLAGLPGGPDPGAGELGGLVLVAGTYTAAAGTFKITSGDLTLDGKNNSNAVWIFQIAQSLTVGKAGQPRSIILINGAQAKNVFWQVGSAATINGAGGGTMAGTIISYSGVTFSTAGNVTLTTLNGRALSLNASVTLVNTIVNVP